MDTLIIEKQNEVYLTVDCDPNIQREISEFFTFYVPGYKFMPAFRNRMWDGKIRLFNLRNNSIYVGLLPYIKEWLSLNGITYSGVQRLYQYLQARYMLDLVIVRCQNLLIASWML